MLNIENAKVIEKSRQSTSKTLPDGVAKFVQEVREAGYRISYAGLALIAAQEGLSTYTRFNDSGKANRVPTVWARKLPEETQSAICRADGGYHAKTGYEDDGTPVLDPDYAVELWLENKDQMTA